MTALAPKLTPLDRRVLEAVPAGRGVRQRDVWAAVARSWRGADYPTGVEVRGVLRGLEHLGLVRGRGGWWARCR